MSFDSSLLFFFLFFLLNVLLIFSFCSGSSSFKISCKFDFSFSFITIDVLSSIKLSLLLFILSSLLYKILLFSIFRLFLESSSSEFSFFLFVKIKTVSFFNTFFFSIGISLLTMLLLLSKLLTLKGEIEILFNELSDFFISNGFFSLLLIICKLLLIVSFCIVEFLKLFNKFEGRNNLFNSDSLINSSILFFILSFSDFNIKIFFFSSSKLFLSCSFLVSKFVTFSFKLVVFFIKFWFSKSKLKTYCINFS